MQYVPRRTQRAAGRNTSRWMLHRAAVTSHSLLWCAYKTNSVGRMHSLWMLSPRVCYNFKSVHTSVIKITKIYGKKSVDHNSGVFILYIKINVCLFGTYTNPHFWTDLNQTLHTSPPWSGGGRRVCMDPQYFNFPTFSTYFVGSECRFVCGRWLLAPKSPATALYPWCGACWCYVA